MNEIIENKIKELQGALGKLKGKGTPSRRVLNGKINVLQEVLSVGKKQDG